MKKTKSISMILTGALIGASLAGPVADAATEYFQAERTAHPVYVDGRQVRLEAYNIGGSNYVKLRDVGQTVGFEVYWDGSAAQVLSNKPHTGGPRPKSPRPPRRPTTAKPPIPPSSGAASARRSTTPSER